MICNPMTSGTNPFEAWQKLWMQGMSQSMTQPPPRQPAPQMVPQAMPQSTDMFGQFSAMQNMWLQGMSAFAPPAQKAVAPANPFMPFGNPMAAMLGMPNTAAGGMQAPKITVTTIELGDMRPYMEMASNMMQAFAPMMNSWSRK